MNRINQFRDYFDASTVFFARQKTSRKESDVKNGENIEIFKIKVKSFRLKVRESF